MAIADARQPTAARDRSGVPIEAPLAVAGALLCISAVTIAAAGSSSDAAFGRALLQLLIVGAPIAVGLYALRAPINRSFGFAMLGIGFAWSFTSMAESDLSVPHTIGRLATWLTFPCVVYVLLAFPRGRIERGLDRAVFAGVVGVMVLLFFGTAPFVEAFPPKTLWSTCTVDCPANALFVLDEQPAFLTDVVLVREWLVEVLWLGLFFSMLRRWRAATPLQRRTVTPAFVAGTLLGLSHYAHITSRQLGVQADTVIALSSVWTFLIVAVCVACLFGLVWRRMLLARTLARLGAAVRAGDDRAHLRDALATAVGDPTVELLFRDPSSGGWRDSGHRLVRWPYEPAPNRAVTTIDTEDGERAVAMIHDVALLDDHELLDSVSGIVLAGWRHERRTADLDRAMRDLEDSRRRIAEAADLERARIERDLHDGAQQRLVAMRIRLGVAAEVLATDPDAGMKMIDALGLEAERALEDVRSLGRGVYPPLLADGGLSNALRSVAAQAPVPVDVVTTGVTRHAVETESAVYFTCVEALQNAVKHAGRDTRVSITLGQTLDTLRFEVRDDGPGFPADGRNGRGLRNMRDRIEAIGGNLRVESQPGSGTRVVGSVQV